MQAPSVPFEPRTLPPVPEHLKRSKEKRRPDSELFLELSSFSRGRTLRVSKTSWSDGVHFADIRAWQKTPGSVRPTKDGIAIPLEMVPAVIEALVALVEKDSQTEVSQAVAARLERDS